MSITSEQMSDQIDNKATIATRKNIVLLHFLDIFDKYFDL